MTKKILILGGTAFVGRAIVEQLLLSGEQYDITLFNRGKTNADLFPQLSRLHGNREIAADVAALPATDWDAVIDVSGYFPLSLQRIVDKLSGHVGRYVFVSTASVYNFAEATGAPITEDFALETCSEAEKPDTSMATYGKRKVACESVLLQSGIDTVVLRPAVIYGANDPFDRHYYWLYRAKKQSRIMIPAETHSATLHNSTYVGDFARIVEAALHVAQHRQIYNAVTHPIASLREVVQAMAKALDTNPQWIDAPIDFLEAEKIQPWSDIPLWINGDFLALDNSRLLADLQPQLTPMTDSFAQTALYYESRGWQIPKVGISIEDEEEMLSILTV